MKSFFATKKNELSQDAITSEATTARAAEQANATAISTEAATARAAEQANAAAITAESTARATALNAKQDAIGTALVMTHNKDGAFSQYANSVSAMMCGHKDYETNVNKCAIAQKDNSETSIGSGNAAIKFEPNGSTKMTLTTTGRLGIGGSSPSEMLHVDGDAKVSGLLVNTSTTTGTYTSFRRKTHILKTSV